MEIRKSDVMSLKVVMTALTSRCLSLFSANTFCYNEYKDVGLYISLGNYMASSLTKSFLFVLGFFMMVAAILLFGFLATSNLALQYQMYILFLGGLGFFAFVLGLVLPHDKKPAN